MATLEQLIKKVCKLGKKNNELNERLNAVTAERDRLKAAQTVCPQCARKVPPRKFRRIDDPDILDKLLTRRRLAMFKAYKLMEQHDRVELLYISMGEDIPDDMELASTNITRSKWAIQSEFLKRFNEAEYHNRQED